MKKGLLVLTLVALILAGCGSAPTATPNPVAIGGGYDNTSRPTGTTIPTLTPWPTMTPYPTAIPDARHNPTYAEMIAFINHSTVVFHNYVSAANRNYVCHDFACDLQEAAALEGIRMAVVAIDFPGPVGHALVAFETTDRGLIYFEPQANLPMQVEIGRSYWSWITGTINYDDTVVAIYMYWTMMWCANPY